MGSLTCPSPVQLGKHERMLNTSAERNVWRGEMFRMLRPVMENLARGTLKQTMPFRCCPEGRERMAQSSCNEAFGRSVCGIAPWLKLETEGDPEGRLRLEWREMVRRAIANAVNPDSPDYLLIRPMHKNMNPQFLVDAAFFAQGLLRAPDELYAKQTAAVRDQIINYLKSVRVISPPENNWLLFCAMVETAIRHFTGECLQERVEYALRRHNEWFKGDGIYGDGALFVFDYYNSFVIHPMIFDILREWRDSVPGGALFRENALRRAARYAAILERMIMADGAFPVVGRSACYRCGVFHHLANMALHHALPQEISPETVRCALTAVIQKILSYPGTYDKNNWLNIGVCGFQPDAAESYISTGSLYLASTVFLPLGLPENDPFWAKPESSWTQKRCWSGALELCADHGVQDE